MSALNDAVSRPLDRLSSAAPVIVRVITGVIMFAHGWQKAAGPGPVGIGEGLLAGLGVPAPVLFGYVLTFFELFGGILLTVGLFTRVVAILMTVNLALAIALVKADVGLIAQQGAGAELDLALIAGFVVSALQGPGRPSVDHVIGVEQERTSRT